MLYLEQAPWFFGAVGRRQVEEEILPLFYKEAKEGVKGTSNLEGDEGAGSAGGAGAGLGSSDGVESSAPSSISTSSIIQPSPPPNLRSASSSSSATGAQSKYQDTLPSSHDLALLFTLFTFGALTDSSLLPAPHNAEASIYASLARAALNLEPVLERPPSVGTVQVISLLAIYHVSACPSFPLRTSSLTAFFGTFGMKGLLANDNSIECTWALMGLASKLAQSVSVCSHILDLSRSLGGNMCWRPRVMNCMLMLM